MIFDESLTSSREDEVLDALEQLDSALRKGEDHRGLIPVLGDLCSSDDIRIRRMSSWCIGKIGQNKHAHPDVTRMMLRTFKDVDSEVRENCAWAIGEFAGAGIGDTDSMTVLATLLIDDDRDVRGMAAWAVGRMADKLSMFTDPCTDAVTALSDDPSPYVRKTAEFALERIRHAQGR